MTDDHLMRDGGLAGLMTAIRKDDMGAVRAWLGQHSGSVNTADSNGWSPLMGAAFAGRYHIAALLLAHDADPGFAGAGGKTALHKATVRGNVDIVELLIGSGAPPTCRDDDGNLPSDLALLNAHWLVVNSLLPDEPSIFRAVVMGDMEMLQRSLSDSSPNERRPNGMTVLHWAAACGRPGVLSLLIACGGDVNVCEVSGWTPLFMAANGPAAETLISAGASVNSPDLAGRTPLHEAAWRGSRGVVQALLDAGADPNAADLEGETPLHQAAFCGDALVVRLLIDGGADTQAATHIGLTAYDIAEKWANHLAAQELRGGGTQ